MLRPTVLAFALMPVAAAAQTGAGHGTMKVTSPAALQWVDPKIPGFAPGMMLAAIDGDPAVADQPYTLRLKFPDGYRFPAHWHPKAENLTVLTGTFLLAVGEKEGGALTSYSAGSFLWIPPNSAHYGGATGETVIQLHGVGPFEIKLVKPATGKGSSSMPEK